MECSLDTNAEKRYRNFQQSEVKLVETIVGFNLLNENEEFGLEYERYGVVVVNLYHGMALHEWDGVNLDHTVMHPAIFDTLAMDPDLKRLKYGLLEEKPIKIYTGNYENIYHGMTMDMWNGVNLDHPATFDTLAMDPDLKSNPPLRNCIFLSSALPPCCCVLRRLRLLPHPPRSGPPISMASEVGVSGDELDGSLFEGMVLFSPSDLLPSSLPLEKESAPPSQYHDPVRPPSPSPPTAPSTLPQSKSRPLDEDIFSDLSLQIPIEPKYLLPAISSPAPLPSPVAPSRLISRKKKRGFRIGYGREAIDSTPVVSVIDPPHPTDNVIRTSSSESTLSTSSCHKELLDGSVHEDLAVAETVVSVKAASDGDELSPSQLGDSEGDAEAFSSTAKASEKDTLELIEDKLNLLRSRISTKLEGIREMATLAYSERKELERKRRNAGKDFNQASMIYKDIEKQLEAACEAEDFEMAEKVSESLAAAEKEKDRLLNTLRETELDCDYIDSRMQEVVKLQIVAEEEGIELLERFAMQGSSNPPLRNCIFLSSALPPCCCVLRRLRLLPHPPRSGPPISMASEVGVSGNELDGSLFEGMVLFSPSDLLPSSLPLEKESAPPSQYHDPVRPPSPSPPTAPSTLPQSKSRPLDEDIFSDLSLQIPIEPKYLLPAISSPAPFPSPAAPSRLISRKKKRGFRIGYGREAIDSTPVVSVIDPPHPTDNVIRTSSSESTLSTSSCHKELLDGSVHEDLAVAETVVSVKAASDGDELSPSQLGDSEGDADAFSSTAKASEKDTLELIEDKLNLIRSRISTKLEGIREMATLAYSERKELERKRRKAGKDFNQASMIYKDLEKQLEVACEAEDFEMAEKVSESLSAAEKEKDRLLNTLRETELDCDYIDSRMQEVVKLQIDAEEEGIELLERFAMDAADRADLIHRNTKELSSKDLEDWQTSMELLETSKLEVDIEAKLISDAHSALDSSIEDLVKDDREKCFNLKELANVALDEAKTYQDLVGLRKELASSIIKSREDKVQLVKTEEKILEEIQVLRQQISTARTKLQELSSTRVSIQQDIDLFKQRIAFVDKRGPELEAEKKVAAASRNFKEAGRIAAEAKTLNSEKESMQNKMDQAVLNLEKLDGDIKSNISMMQENEELVLLKEKEAAVATFKRLQLIAAAARSERSAALELGDLEESEFLLKEAEAAEERAGELQGTYSLNPEDHGNTQKYFSPVALITKISGHSLAEMAAFSKQQPVSDE
ncbi:hypothetical protein MA16_Dca022516 [Dendrobium catenatum]|uniref:UVR domain-containing protein n=1 Tax=Dendrobium catenatum TaxID=906689 RepID=A0A2I0VJS3_9ASPA|nr:hypothetical protein MA16_Dca022516 [Dendrobium catenatum]